MMRPKLDPRFLPLILLALMILHIPCCLCEDDYLYETCKKPFECGGMSFGYPFWSGDDRQAACGQRGFELSCEDNITRIDAESVSYRVLHVDNETRTLKVARDDLWAELCPKVVHNTTFDSNPFNFYREANDREIFLFYGCSQLPSQLTPYQFKCNISGADAWSFFQNPVLNWPTSAMVCGIYISARVNETAAGLLEVSPTRDLFLDALKNGFWIQWNSNDACGDCKLAGGVCGQYPDSGNFVCHCSHGTQTSNCTQTENVSSKKSSKPGRTIGISIASVVVAGIGIGFLIFCCRKRRKQRHQRLAVQSSHTVDKDITGPPSSEPLSTPNSSNFTRSTPSYPSSNSELAQASTYFGAHVFNFAELEAATDNFNPSRELGDGGFGTVYYGVLHDGREVAVKRLYESNYKRMDQFMNEVEILTQVRHVNLVVLYGCTSRRSRDLLLVYEYIPNGTVADHLHGKRAKSGLLSWPVRLNIAIETADAMMFLHKSEIVHRDIKTNNILLDKNFHVKVADFGLSRLFPSNVTHVSTAPQGTPGYVDPEYYQCYHLTEKSDVYSFGVVLIELISSLQAVDITRHRHDINLANMAINKIQNRALHDLVDSSLGFETNATIARMVKLVAELAFQCLQQERDMRPTMEQVLEALKEIQRDDINAHKVDIVEALVESNESEPPKGTAAMPSPDSATPLMDK